MVKKVVPALGLLIALALLIYINSTKNSTTPNLYLGYDQLERFASPEVIVRDKELIYSVPHQIRQNYIAYGGTWLIAANHSRPKRGSYLKLPFDATEILLDAKLIDKTQKSQVRVILDDQEQKTIEVNTDNLYQLVKLDEQGKHILKLEFLDENIEIYFFTFH